MTPDWSPLTDELANWQSSDMSFPLWWRDDDAIAPTPALTRLHDLARALDIPVHIAVIPAHAEPALADEIDRYFIPVVHGWAHANHAPEGQKKAEFGAHRPLADMQQETDRALSRIRSLFGDAAEPIFVPPWNRISDALPPVLAAQGYKMLSTFTPRKTALAAAGLVQINTHLDPINWRAGKTLHDPQTLIAQVANDLHNRRTGVTDTAEPYGILTHHLVHDGAIWSFTETLLSRLLDGPAHIWTSTDKDTPT